jgi:hypothetical protein
MLNNQIEGEIIKQVHKWDNHTIILRNMKEQMSFIFKTKNKENMMWIFFGY